MAKAFHHLMQALVILLGIAMVVMGGVWILQGFGIAFLDSFMANDRQWAINGALLALFGLGQAIWAATRAGYYRRR